MVRLRQEIRYDFLWERRPFHNKYLNIFDTSKIFSEYYNRIGPNSKRTRHDNTVDFYYEIAKACGLKKSQLPFLHRFLEIITKELSDWDMFVRKKKLTPDESRKLVWASDGMTLEEELLLTDRIECDYNLVKRLITKGLSKTESEKIKSRLHLDNKSFAVLRSKTLNTVRKEFKLTTKLGLSFKRYIEVAETDLCNVEDYYGWKKKPKGKPNKSLELEIINKGKSHFYYYNHILYHLIMNSGIRGDIKLIHYLDNYLKHYLELLFVCQELLDLKQDIKENNFNLIVWLYKCIHKKEKLNLKNYHKILLESKVYDLLLSVVDESAQKTSIALLEIEKHNKKLYKLLSLYFDGIVEGLDVFLRHRFLRNQKLEKAEKIKELVLNPHPWEETRFNRTFPDDLKVKKKAIKLIADVRDELKRITKCKDPHYKPGQYNSISSAASRLLNVPTYRCIIPLRSRGCSFAFIKGGPCHICGVRGDNLWKRSITPKQIVDQFKKDFAKIDFKKHSILGVYCNGSFLDDAEVDPKARDTILKIIAKEKGVLEVDFESRPEYVTLAKVKRVKKILGKKLLTPSTGFDAIDEDVRNIIVNKGMTREGMEKATSAFVRAHVSSLVYVGIKPPFLTEREAIQEAVDTIEYLFRIGIEQISLEPVTVQDYTLTKYLYDRKLFRPTWLWSIIEILKATHTKMNIPLVGPEVVGGFVFFPLPKVVAHNCPKCDKKVVAALNKFSETQDIRVFDKLKCSCKKQWEKEVEKDAPPLYERIVSTLEKAKKIKK